MVSVCTRISTYITWTLRIVELQNYRPKFNNSVVRETANDMLTESITQSSQSKLRVIAIFRGDHSLLVLFNYISHLM